MIGVFRYEKSYRLYIHSWNDSSEGVPGNKDADVSGIKKQRKREGGIVLCLGFSAEGYAHMGYYRI